MTMMGFYRPAARRDLCHRCPDIVDCLVCGWFFASVLPHSHAARTYINHTHPKPAVLMMSVLGVFFRTRTSLQPS